MRSRAPRSGAPRRARGASRPTRRLRSRPRNASPAGASPAQAPAARAGERLQKALARLGLASRRAAEEWIRAGRLTVNSHPAELGMRVSAADQIRLDGRLIRHRPAAAQQVLLCHRSPGEPLAPPRRSRHAGADAAAIDSGNIPPQARASGSDVAPGQDRAERDEVPASLIERLPRIAGRRFVPVSPMPLPDGGLELVTSDGELAERLQRAVRGLTVEFRVRVLGGLDETQLEQLRAGQLDRGIALEVLECQPAGGEASNQWYALSVRGASGKDVRQLFERQGARVSRILRTRLGPVSLDRALGRGRFRRLNPEELRSLLAAAEHRSSPP